jgi:hypothetical protein
MNTTNMLALALILLTLIIMAVIAFLDRKRIKINFRHLPSLDTLQKAINLVVEGGKGMHISLGRGNSLSPQFAGSLMSLHFLKILARQCLNGDIPPLATSGDGLLNILSQETMDSASAAAQLPEDYEQYGSQVTGVTPFSYTVGTMIAQRDENQAVMVIAGYYGAEVALIADMAERSRSHTISGTDDVTAQAMLFVTTRAPLIGEEFFAAGAYIHGNLLHTTSIKTQDLLRILLSGSLIVGVILKVVGVI